MVRLMNAPWRIMIRFERLESVISQTEEKNTAEEKHMRITTSIQNAPNEKTHE